MKVFVSQPMKNKTEDEILEERNEIIRAAEKKYGEIDVIESYIPDDPDCRNSALYKLGESLCMLADADVAVFAEGWRKARECRIEHSAAKNYGIEVFEV